MVPTGRDKPRSYNSDYMKLGREGEEIVLAYLRGNPKIVGVEDFRELRAVHQADIDCGIVLRDGRVTLAENNTDSYRIPPNLADHFRRHQNQSVGQNRLILHRGRPNIVKNQMPSTRPLSPCIRNIVKEKE